MIQKIERFCIWFLLWRIKRERIEMSDKKKSVITGVIRTLQNMAATEKMVADDLAKRFSSKPLAAATSRWGSIQTRLSSLLEDAEELEKEELRATAIKEAEAIEASRRLPAKKAAPKKAVAAKKSVKKAPKRPAKKKAAKKK